MYRRGAQGPELLLVHPGGPFWVRKDLGAWSIPKGEYSETEDPLEVAMREFEEETGMRPCGELRPLGEVTQPGRKVVTAFALEGDFDPATLKSNTFDIAVTLEHDPGTGLRKKIMLGFAIFSL